MVDFLKKPGLRELVRQGHLNDGSEGSTESESSIWETVSRLLSDDCPSSKGMEDKGGTGRVAEDDWAGRDWRWKTRQTWALVMGREQGGRAGGELVSRVEEACIRMVWRQVGWEGEGDGAKKEKGLDYSSRELNKIRENNVMY